LPAQAFVLNQYTPTKLEQEMSSTPRPCQLHSYSFLLSDLTLRRVCIFQNVFLNQEQKRSAEVATLSIDNHTHGGCGNAYYRFAAPTH
jgi:hypothetical protein